MTIGAGQPLSYEYLLDGTGSAFPDGLKNIVLSTFK
jgi:hypothetical protein